MKVGQGIVAHTFNPSTLEAEAGKSLLVQDHSDIHSKFQAGQG